MPVERKGQRREAGRKDERNLPVWITNADEAENVATPPIPSWLRESLTAMKGCSAEQRAAKLACNPHRVREFLLELEKIDVLQSAMRRREERRGREN